MKKAVIIFLILIVLGIVGYFVYTEISVKDISYVSSVENDDKEGRYSVKRLYSSDIDVEAFNKKVENLLLLEFSDEDIEAAALEAGTPQFYPAFHIYTHKPRNEENTLYVDLSAVQELAPGQEDIRYSMTNLRLEAMTTGVSIVEAKAVGKDSLDRTINEAILKNDSGTGMLVELNDYGSVNLKLEGVTGNIVLQYTFDVRSNSLLPKTVLTGCMAMIKISVITNSGGETEISYQLESATTIDEYIEQE